MRKLFSESVLRAKRVSLVFILALFAIQPAYADETPMRAIQEVKAAGVSAWLLEDDTLPLVTMRVHIEGAGTASDTAEKAGRASMAARLLTEGAGEYDAQAYTKALEAQAIQLSTGVSKDAFSLSLKTTKDGLKEAFRLTGLALAQANFAPEDVTRIREEMLAQLRVAQGSPHYHASVTMRELLYGEHPYANLVYGTPESLAALNSEALKEYAARYLTKDRAIISVVGDVSAGELAALFETHLASIPEIAQPEAVIEEVALTDAPAYAAKEMDVPQSVIAFVAKGVARNHPDFYAAYLLNHMVGGGGLTSLLAEALRQEEGLTYSVSAGLSNDTHVALWQGGLSTRTDGVVKSIQIINDTLAKIAANGVDEALFLRAKSYLTGSFAISLDNTSTLSAYLELMQQQNLGMDYLEKRNAYFEAVSLEDVQRVAADLLARPRYTVVVGKDAKAQVTGGGIVNKSD